MLKVNNRELTGASFKPARLEGRLGYGVTKGHGFLSRIQFKEYWFKLLGNLLFYFGLNSHGGIKSSVSGGNHNSLFQYLLLLPLIQDFFFQLLLTNLSSYFHAC